MKGFLCSCLLVLGSCTAPLLAQDQEEGTSEAQPYVARGQFTTAINNREPVDQVVLVSPPVEEVYFFSDVRHMDGDTVNHNWWYQGELVAQVSFEVGGPRWRVYSKRRIKPGEFGEWSVTVTDGSGWPLYTELFHYGPSDTEVSAQGMRAPQ